MISSYQNSNKRGIPTIATIAINTNGTVTSLVLPDNTFLGKWYQGIIFIEVNQELPAATTNTISLQVNGEVRPLIMAGGTDVTVTNIAANGSVFQVYYDKPRNYLQLMSPVL